MKSMSCVLKNMLLVMKKFLVYKGMPDPIIISYKLTTIVSVTYYRIQQYPVKYIYNTWSSNANGII